MSRGQGEKLIFQNTEFAVHHLIDNCPAHTVIRELLKNAEENAVLNERPGKIEWFEEEVAGVRKLGLFNEGPGMSADDLRRLMDLASTGKSLGVYQNFGQGGKVSGLKASPAGVVYRSRKSGRVCEIVLAAEQRAGVSHPVYVKKRFRIADEEGTTWETVLDVTDRYRGRRDRPLTRDWTEVVLLGACDDHDTVGQLLPNSTRTNWLIREVNQRFFRFPPGVVVQNADATSGQRNARNAHGLEQLTRHWSTGGDGRYEDVAATHPQYGPVTIRYCKLKGNFNADTAGNSRARTMEAYGIGTRGDHITLVWKGECYEILTGWSRISRPFGVTFGSANVAVQILLPDDAPVKNNTYRDRLLRRDDSGHYLVVDEFADVVCEYRPQWLIDYVDEQARQNNTSSNVMDRLRQYLQDLMVVGSRRDVVQPGGDDEGEIQRGDGGGHGNGNGSRDHRPGRGRRTSRPSDGIPRVEFTRDPAILGDMRGRAAMYRRTENLVLLNPDHFRYQAELQRLLDDVGPDAERRQTAQRIFEEEYMVQAGQFVIQAWLFRGRADWDDSEFEEALNMGAMTVHLASPATRAAALHRYNQRMAVNRMQAASSN